VQRYFIADREFDPAYRIRIKDLGSLKFNGQLQQSDRRGLGA
jgi:hypothetical protein